MINNTDFKKCNRVIRPNKNGTKKLFAKYGSKLIAVRYRYTKKHAYVTIETIVDVKPRKVRKVKNVNKKQWDKGHRNVSAVPKKRSRRRMKKIINISAIKLERCGNYTDVLIEIDGEFVRVIRELYDNNFSHIVEASGIEEAIKINNATPSTT